MKTDLTLKKHYILGLFIIAAVTLGLQFLTSGWGVLDADPLALYFILGLLSPLVCFAIALRYISSNKLLVILSVVPAQLYAWVAKTSFSESLFLTFGKYSSGNADIFLTFLSIAIITGACFYIFKKLLVRPPAVTAIIFFGLCALFAVALPSIGASFDNAQYQQDKLEKARTLDFKIYRPVYTPSNYKAMGGGNLIIDSEQGLQPHYEFNYDWYRENPEDPGGSYTLYVFRADKSFNPPNDCGPVAPSYSVSINDTQKFPCELIGNGPENQPIYSYRSQEKYSSNLHIYMQQGNSLITLDFDNNNELSEQDAIVILSSLEETTPDEEHRAQQAYEKRVSEE